ncbi:hypothetical protein Tco_1227320 [Tanacetum coccineum]
MSHGRIHKLMMKSVVKIAAERPNQKEREELADEEKGKLFMELMEKRRKHFDALKAQEKRNIPPTSTKESKEKKDKGSEETAKGSRKKMLGRKRAGKQQQQESSKKQKIKEDKESDEVEEVSEDDEGKKRVIEAFVIVDYKLHKEDMLVHYQLIRADGSSKNKFNDKDLQDRQIRLEVLWRIVKAKHNDTRPEDEFERVLWGDLKVMFEPDTTSDVWRMLQGYMVTIWKLIDSSGVHFVRFDNLHIFMLVERRYPLTPITITNMLTKKLQTDRQNEMCYQLLKLMIEVGTTTNNNLTARLPILNPGDYDLWLMRIEQYFLMNGYSLWEVIKNGNKVLKKMVGTVEHDYEPTSVEEKQERRNEKKARATLLMALPNKDQLKFHSYQDAKLLMEAIEKSSESLDQTFDRIQKLIRQLEIQGEVINQEDMNLKLLRGLPSEWKYHALIWRNKAEIKTISLDDLYNNMKIYETELTGYNRATAASPAVEDFVNLTDKFEADKAYHAVHPPLIGNFIPRKPDLTFIDEIVESEILDVTTVVTPINVKIVVDKDISNTVESNDVRMDNTSAPIIED